jgi:hypothetical protein
MSGSTRKFESQVLLRLEDADIPLGRHIPTVIGKRGGGLSFMSEENEKAREERLIAYYSCHKKYLHFEKK